MSNDEITTIVRSFDLSGLTDEEKAAYWKGYNDYSNGVSSVTDSSDQAYQAGYERARQDDEQHNTDLRRSRT
ncbi:MAG TPA: hypothetical protein VFD58_15175 [Blastocatellia bacterium]|nr:hypothetical protein [Blastocatellia bacterium]